MSGTSGFHLHRRNSSGGAQAAGQRWLVQFAGWLGCVGFAMGLGTMLVNCVKLWLLIKYLELMERMERFLSSQGAVSVFPLEISVPCVDSAKIGHRGRGGVHCLFAFAYL